MKIVPIFFAGAFRVPRSISINEVGVNGGGRRKLAIGDVTIQQQLLNYFPDLEKEQAVKGAQVQLLVMLKHLVNLDGRLVANSILQIGKHRFDLSFEAKASGVSLEDPKAYRPSSTGDDWS